MSEKSFTVIHQFTSGEWTYRPGEKFTEADFQLRGLEGSDFARHLRRGEIADSTSVQARIAESVSVEAERKMGRTAAATAPKAPAPTAAPPPATPETKI